MSQPARSTRPDYSTRFQPGARHPRWKGGRPRNEKGYVRLMVREHRGKYEHRVVIERLLQAPLCADYVFPEKGRIPANMTVNHQDQVRTHNCPANLMLLEKAIHDAISVSYAKYIREHYEEFVVWHAAKAEEESVPDWVTEEYAG